MTKYCVIKPGAAYNRHGVLRSGDQNVMATFQQRVGVRKKGADMPDHPHRRK